MGGGGSKSKKEDINNPINPYKIAKEEFFNYKTNDNIYISNDKILSIWIIIYFLLYYLNITKYNPIILILLAVLFQIILIFIIFYYNKYNNINFNIIVLFIKLLMIYGLYYIKKINITAIDILFTILFIFTYLIYISLYNENIYDIYIDIINNNIDENKGRTIGVRYYLNKWLY